MCGNGWGHPRVGGEHEPGSAFLAGRIGSSPRGRGTRQSNAAGRLRGRVIPAWAGNTAQTPARSGCRTGHPRVGGEHEPARSKHARTAGSSPRGRGTHRCCHGCDAGVRVIPAWAGNTDPPFAAAPRLSGHPRVGGEHRGHSTPTPARPGSSPRGRGTQGLRHMDRTVRRVIPAWAGNTRPPGRGRASWPGHPRVGGEHMLPAGRGWQPIGSSPRGRGTQRDRARPPVDRRVIPAWAGNTISRRGWWDFMTGHPRVGGEHFLPHLVWERENGSSPRGRGTPLIANTRRRARRVIPAWAGNTLDRPMVITLMTGHPRVGGEHVSSSVSNAGALGSSPRGRGTPAYTRWRQAHWRVIPAWAGNTLPADS